MEIVEFRKFFQDMSKDQFDRSFATIIQDEIFSAIASGVGTDHESYIIGTQLQSAGLTDLNPHDPTSVLNAARAASAKVYEVYYRP